MKRSGAWLVKYALEQLPLHCVVAEKEKQHQMLNQMLATSENFQFIELFQIKYAPYLAQSIARVSEQLGCVLATTNAGATELTSGIAQAFYDGVPLLIVADGCALDLPSEKKDLQLDRMNLFHPITKQVFLVESYELIVPTLFEAYAIAKDGEPGPVYVEIPQNLQNELGEPGNLAEFIPLQHQYTLDEPAIDQSLALLDAAEKPCILVGWGSREATQSIVQIATHLAAPVVTTLQGASCFPTEHPLHTGCVLGESATLATRRLLEHCDCLLAIGTRLGGSATSQFTASLPANLIHLDINPQVFNRHYPARVTIHGDAKVLAELLLDKIQFAMPKRDARMIESEISEQKLLYKKSWHLLDSLARVNPIRLFEELKLQLQDNALIFVDDANLRLMAANLMSFSCTNSFNSTSDFCGRDFVIASAVGAKLVHPDRQVVAIMSQQNLLSNLGLLAFIKQNSLPIMLLVLTQDGELELVDKAKNENAEKALLGHLGIGYFLIGDNQNLQAGISDALDALEKQPQVVEVMLDNASPMAATKPSIEATIRAKSAIESKVKNFGRSLLKKIFRK